MAVTYPAAAAYPMKPAKRARRTATTVLAGDFDVRPQRDVLTSLLNGVGPYTPMQRLDDDEARRQRKREKRERERERKKEKAKLAALANEMVTGSAGNALPASTSFSISAPQPRPATSSMWGPRPSIHIATNQRSQSVTPSPPPLLTSPYPLPSTPASTPGPSNSSSTSRTSSKRPRTPDDDEELVPGRAPSPPHVVRVVRRKRIAAKKGWKGWVEGSPPPSEKLINLDAVPILQERRTRSGKNFDAIGVGKDGWV